MADTKSASADQAKAAAEDMSVQISALREDLARLSESVVSLGQGAKAAVTDEASLAVERVREKVRDEPLYAVAIAAGIGYVLGMLNRH